MDKSISHIIDAARHGALILTANKRLYRYLRRVYDQQMAESQALVWSSAQFFPYEAWLRQQFDRLGDSRRLLSIQQQRHLWQEQIAATVRGSSLELMNLDKTADTAVRAHNLLSEYAISLDAHDLTEDQQVFHQWRLGYLRQCGEHHWIDQGDLARQVLVALEQDKLPLPKQLLLVGFDQLPPGAAALQALVVARGGQCPDSEPDEAVGNVIRYAAVDEAEETGMMARWVRRLLEQGAKSIGIVVPDLQRRRRSIERSLSQQVDPDALPRLREVEGLNLSLGGPLAEVGVVTAALNCLTLGARLSMEQISFLLRTPFIAGSVTEADQRALFDQRLRSFQQQDFSLKGLIRLAEQFARIPGLVALLTRLADRTEQRCSTETWAGHFAAELKAVGWPGEVTLSSTTYQGVKAWYDKVLNQFAGIDPLLQPISRYRAVAVVRQLAQDLEFQPQSAAGPVQVVGLLESSGLCFEHLWVMGLSEGVIPGIPRPNPFIPHRLQQKFRMPHADFSRELEFAEQVIKRLQAAAPEIVFSYPERSGDCELDPSPLIVNIGVPGTPETALPVDPATLVAASGAALEPWEDDSGPPLTGRVSGGTRLLQDQAHCPFRAYVHHRLKVSAFDQVQPGLSPAVRGDLIHLTLEGIWRVVKDQRTYLSLTPQQQQSLFAEQAEKAITRFSGDRFHAHRQLLELEKARIIRLMTEWFDTVERKRVSFCVEATEEQHQIDIGSLQLKLKIDRIDRLASGERIVVDYKTGNQLKTADFLTTPLIEPQLPCYAVTAEVQGDHAEAIQGILVGTVKSGTCRFLGLTAGEGLVAGAKSVAQMPQATVAGIDDWTQLQAFWQEQLTRSAAEFAAGTATVRPFDRQRSCRYCDLPGLCRIGDVEQAGGDDDDN